MDTTKTRERIIRCPTDDTFLLKTPDEKLTVRLACRKCSKRYLIKIENGNVTVNEETRAN